MKYVSCLYCGGAGITMDSQRWNIVAISCWHCGGKGVVPVPDDFHPVSNNTYIQSNI